jgi:MATE family multidrug resistance protein
MTGENIMIKNITLITAVKRIFALALPMAGTQFVNVGSGFLCMVMLAALGHDVLAASALIVSTQLSIMVSGMSLLFSLSVLVGHAYGAKDHAAIGLSACKWVVRCCHFL